VAAQPLQPELTVKRSIMNDLRLRSLAVCLLIAGVLMGGCGSGSEQGHPPESPLPTAGVGGTAAALPTDVPTPTTAPTATTAPVPTAASSALQLVILHTNDNWGETEPCG
jgi:hypothetical protein